MTAPGIRSADSFLVMMSRHTIPDTRRWVVKIGSALLTRDGQGLERGMLTERLARGENTEGDSAGDQEPTERRRLILDERGEDLTTKALARRLERWQEGGDDVAIIIGGPDGLDPALKASAHETMRLSSLTLPHAMVRVMLAEAVYRAWSVLKNHPYHRE